MQVQTQFAKRRARKEEERYKIVIPPEGKTKETGSPIMLMLMLGFIANAHVIVADYDRRSRPPSQRPSPIRKYSEYEFRNQYDNPSQVRTE